MSQRRIPTIQEMMEANHGGSAKFEPAKTENVPFVRPKLVKRGSETEQRLAGMRERFLALQLVEEDKADSSKPDVTDSTDSPIMLPNTAETNTASARWSKIRKVVNWPATGAEAGAPGRKAVNLLKAMSTISSNADTPTSPRSPSPRDESGKTSPRQKRKILKRPSEQSVKKSLEDAQAASMELEDITLVQLWANNELPEVPDRSANAPTLALVSDREALRSDMNAELFTEDAKPLKVTVSRIPEAVVSERKAEMERLAQEERLIMLDKLRKREEDIDFRENTAREELRVKEQEARKRLDAEKQKAASLALRKQKNLAQDFRKMREQLEEGVRKQQGAIKENFGKLLVHEETLARRFHAASKLAPQPVEFRIHMMRAVKNKLPKGVYVLMLTQYDSVGGRPLSWSRIGSNGIGNMRPGITRMCRHEGRYFDRVLRVEDSCFALCPPRPLLKPNFVFVLELFQLASKHNPQDKIEAWTAVPMTYESMSIIEGKIKLPLLRGEHSPAVQQFKTMEQLIASDLHNWLCNIYIEVRHMSLSELGATDEMLKTTDFDMDYFNKSFIPLDVDGNPILSAAQQEDLALERDLEAAGFSASGKFSGAGAGTSDPNSPKRVKFPLKDETDPEYEVPLLSVDKGIFRRKVAHTGPPSAGAGAAAADEETGLAGANGPVEMAPTGETPGDSSHGDSKKRLSPKPGRFRSTSGEKLHGSSSHSLMSMMGLKSNSDVNKPLLLKNDDNFLEHRKLLVERWKDNIRSKGLDSSNHNSSFHDDRDDEVLERGYNIQDEVFLHREQRGKLPGVEAIAGPDDRKWAAAGLEGKIVRRWQSEGPRFDSEAIADPSQRARSSANLVSPGNREPTWEELRDSREMEDYTMAICTDVGKKKGVVPGAKSASKLRYIELELFGDFNYYLWGTFEFYMAIGIWLFALWIRIYVHYLAQYLYLVSLDTPVFSFRLMVFQIVQKYMSASISVAAETGVVAIGPIANICVFISFVGLGMLFHKVAEYLPEVISKFFAAFGVAAILDPILVIIIDLIYHNYNCTASSDACKEDYTSSECNCFNGDFLKLWYRMVKEEGSGLTGLFIMLLLYMGTVIIGGLILYQYIVYVHRDARILDQWRRVNGTVEEFFIPHDFEVSDEELKAIVYKAVHWRGPQGSRRHLETQEYVETDPAHPYFNQTYKKFMIIEVDEKKNRAVFREFLMEPDGAILEIFESRNAHYNATSIFNNVKEGGDQTDKEEAASKEDDEASEHTGQRGGSPRTPNGGSGSAFPELRSMFGRANSVSKEKGSPRDGETQPLLRPQKSRLSALAIEPYEEEAVYF